MAKGAAGGDADEEEGEAGAGDGVPAKFGRRRGLAGKEDGAPVLGEVMATSADAQGAWQRRPDAEQWRQRHCRRRGGTSGGLRGKQKAGRRRGGGCDAGGGDGTAGRRTVEEGEAAGSAQRGGKRRATAGRWLGTTGDRGRGLKRENGARGFHFI
uniref:BKRF1 encodes EBNA-1 protein-like n=1 Tax=Oryza sativa subsp. japonica TaxID=39947 RepID=Q6EQ41_ORYSJ|nr:BKRF1 encodes EBNA-1 protein-like [Oryza sativa Japonica Group]BAD34128.1 BKRF1 encodes EBNA-1 protein-like [Oryza sativa Japonica Group]